MPHDEAEADQLALSDVDATYHCAAFKRLRCAECGGQLHSVKPWRLEGVLGEPTAVARD